MPDASTGYLVNIRELDLLMRLHAIPLTARLLDAEGVRLTGIELVRGVRDAIVPGIPPHCRLESLRLSTTPFLSYAIHESEPSMVELTQSFEFSASHRLHVPGLSDEDNRRIFGKCNNPRGHGHNYQLEVTIADAADPVPGLPLPEFEARVKRGHRPAGPQASQRGRAGVRGSQSVGGEHRPGGLGIVGRSAAAGEAAPRAGVGDGEDVRGIRGECRIANSEWRISKI